MNKVHNSEYYNLKIFDKIIKYFFINKVKIVEKKTLFQKSEKSKKFIFINKIESFLKKIFFIILSYYKKNIFFTTFFSKKSFFKIKNLIGSSCNLYFFFNFYNCFDNNQYNLEYRKKLLLNFNSSNKFEEFLKLNLFIEIPMSYLETYNEIKKIVKQSNLRKQKIITTVEYTMDDFYKIWIAEKKKYGSKIYIYDHSNSLRCNFFDYNHDFIISKKIISNLKIKNSHYINLPEIKFSINKSKYLNKDGKKISIIMYEGPKYTGKCISAPTSLTNYQLFKQLLIFYSKLNFKIKKNVKFKSPPYSNERFGTHSKIKKILGDSKIYDYRDKMVNVIKDSKLLICTYPQTSFLEILISEKPFILLISKKHWMFDKFGEKLISKLIKSNLLFTNELLAARHINKISENINKWWDSKENQKNLSYLKSNYFNFNINTSNSWRKFLSK